MPGSLEKEIPWCTVFLCCVALLCHTLVLDGNMMTSLAVKDMGKSVKGWSNIGVSVGDALHEELDALLGNVTFQLTQAIQETIETQEMVDMMLSQMGEQSGKTALLETQNLVLLQGNVVHKHTGEVAGDPMGAVMKIIMKVMKSLPSFQDGLAMLQDMMHNLKPALMQVGVWVETFADRVQSTVESFGTTLDRVQKIFDHLMAQLAPDAGGNAEDMLHETFNLFDVDGDGEITLDDLKNCGDLYAVDALKGTKGQELIDTYDADENGSIDITELSNLVADPSIVGIMATVLRAYAKRLSMVAGKVGGSRMRDEVAQNVVSYFQLVCSKNLTKVGWVSDMLTNGTLPLPFTADVMAELALQKDDPNVLTTADVGEIVIGMMMNINSKYTMEALDLMSTTEHWETEGFNPEDQDDCVKTVTHWTQTGPDAVDELEKHMIAREEHTVGSLVAEESHVVSEEEEDTDMSHILTVLEAVPLHAQRIAKENTKRHLAKRYRNRKQKRLELFGTEAKQTFLIELLHGQACQDGPSDLASKALASGVEAKPETKLFAQWLMANASQTANRFQKMCFDYTGESSSALDAFNTQIQGMVKKVSGFIDIMKQYATPKAIDGLEETVMDFASKAMKDVFMVVADQVLDAMNSSSSLHEIKIKEDLFKPVLDNAANETPAMVLDDWIRSIGRVQDKLSHMPKARSHMDFKSHEDSAYDPFDYEQLKKRYAAHKSMDIRDNPDRYHADLLQVVARRLEGQQSPDVPAGLSGIWDQVSDLLRQLEQVLPQAIDILKFARKEVSAVSATLDSIFSTLEEKGYPIFTQVAIGWQFLWVFYFFLVMPLTAGILFYGFWAGGFFGGPKAQTEIDDEYEPPETFIGKCCACCSACCRCCRWCHDLHLCFWSFIILFQVIVLLLFIVSIVFMLIGAVQIFIGTGCGMIYIIGDVKICTETLRMLSTFLSTFIVGDGDTPLSMSCHHYNLLACDIVHDKMLQSTILTIVGSFVAALLSFQMIFATAVLHERAVWRRRVNEYMFVAEEAKKAPAST